MRYAEVYHYNLKLTIESKMFKSFFGGFLSLENKSTTQMWPWTFRHDLTNESIQFIVNCNRFAYHRHVFVYIVRADNA